MADEGRGRSLDCGLSRSLGSVSALRSCHGVPCERDYLRTLLIHGARSVIQYAEKKSVESSWLRKLMARRNKNVAAVALANKNARTIWALLAHDRMFRSDYTRANVAAVV